jgi:hypothetical protein
LILNKTTSFYLMQFFRIYENEISTERWKCGTNSWLRKEMDSEREEEGVERMKPSRFDEQEEEVCDPCCEEVVWEARRRSGVAMKVKDWTSMRRKEEREARGRGRGR